MNGRRLRLIASSSSTILNQLRWYAFRRLELEVRVGSSASAICKMVNDAAPDVVVVESSLADGDGFTVSRFIKGEKALADVLVVVVAEAGISQDVASAIVGSGCDWVLVCPLSAGQLYELVADHLDLPRRHHARVSVRARATAGPGDISGHLIDLTPTGARIRLAKAPSASKLALQIESSSGPAFSLDAKVVWQKPYQSGVELALRFAQVPLDLQEEIRALLTWEIQPAGTGGQIVRILVDLDERLDLSRLVERLEDTVEFDLSHLRHINSVGVGRWIDFLQTVPPRVKYRLGRCSAAFAQQAGYLPGMIGRGTVSSLFSSFECPKCDREVEREISAKDASNLPTMTCVCGGVLLFSGDPKRTFACLAKR